MTLPDYKRTFYARHYAEAPQVHEADGAPTWITRAASFVIVITHGKAGTELVRAGNPDEYMVILGEGASATLAAGGQTEEVGGDTLCILPPGQSSVTLSRAGTVLRIFSNKADDLTGLSVNAAAYASGVDGIAPVIEWPEPVGGFKIRHYDLAKFVRADGPLIQPRIFRSTNLMVNVFSPWHALRETTKLGPHFHDDFEQGSVGMQGGFVHHVRYPWNSDLSDWYADEHVEIGSPSVAIIPPPLVHTSRNASADESRLVDVFAPPRVDFSLKPGFVLNADEYPMPPHLHDQAEAALSVNVSTWGS